MKRLVFGVLVVGLSVVAPAGARAQGVPDMQVSKERISTMEGILERAVQNGVNSLRSRVRAVMPDDALLQGGLPEVRGFPLQGFGVFFDIEVPMLRQSMAWTLRAMNEANLMMARDLAIIKQLTESVSDPQSRAQVDRALQNIQRQVGPAPQVGSAPQVAERTPQVAERTVQPLANGTVSATSLSAAAPAPVIATAPAAPQVDTLLLLDPNEAFTQEVKKALVEAIVTFGGSLGLGPEEWLTVAAKDNAPVNPLVQADSDYRTIMLRIKGSDLIEYQMGRLTPEQVRARVSILEF